MGDGQVMSMMLPFVKYTLQYIIQSVCSTVCRNLHDAHHACRWPCCSSSCWSHRVLTQVKLTEPLETKPFLKVYDSWWVNQNGFTTTRFSRFRPPHVAASPQIGRSDSTLSIGGIMILSDQARIYDVLFQFAEEKNTQVFPKKHMICSAYFSVLVLILGFEPYHKLGY